MQNKHQFQCEERLLVKKAKKMDVNLRSRNWSEIIPKHLKFYKYFSNEDYVEGVLAEVIEGLVKK